MPKIVESNLIFNQEKNIFFKCISLTKIWQMSGYFNYNPTAVMSFVAHVATSYHQPYRNSFTPAKQDGKILQQWD